MELNFSLFIQLVYLGVAIGRLSYGLTSERGYMGIFEKAKMLLTKVKYVPLSSLSGFAGTDENEELVPIIANEVGLALECPSCTSLLVSFPILILWLLIPAAFDIYLYIALAPLFMSGVARMTWR
jgi:hypothetical protein